MRAEWTHGGAAWERWEPVLLHSLAAVDPVLLRSLELRPRMRVLDVGSGLGEPALTIARWIEPGGSVLGLDISPSMIDVARRRARLLRISNAWFRAGDIGRYAHRGPRFDAVVSRFGIMFADDVPRALEAIRASLKTGGRAAFAVWAEPERNAAFTIAARVMGRWLTAPAADPASAPHPMRFSRKGSLPRLLRRAGFRRVREQETPAPFIYPDPESFVAAILDVSFGARALYAAVPRSERARVRTAMAREAARYQDGPLVRLPGVARVVSGVK